MSGRALLCLVFVPPIVEMPIFKVLMNLLNDLSRRAER